MLTVTDLSKTFGAQVLFEDVHIQLDKGKRYELRQRVG